MKPRPEHPRETTNEGTGTASPTIAAGDVPDIATEEKATIPPRASCEDSSETKQGDEAEAAVSPLRPKMTPRVEAGIRKATAMLAAGHSWEETAAAVFLGPEGLKSWKKVHPELWRQEYERALEAAMVVVQRLGGTEAVALDPEMFVREATRCDRWARKQGAQTTLPQPGMTLGTFYATYFKPVRLADAASATVVHYDGVVKRWVALTGDPPLGKVDADLLAHYRNCLQKMPGKNKKEHIAPATVANHLKHIQTILDKAGPAGPKNRDAASVISSVPWIKPPRVLLDPPKAIPLDRIAAVYRAADEMAQPMHPNIPTARWWRSLIVVAFATALRRRTLFELRMEDVDWQNRRLVIPGRRLKSGRPLVVPLNEMAYRHLEAIRLPERTLVFPWPHTMKHFQDVFHRLQDAAGIPFPEHFGLHALRKTHATALWEISPQAAQLSLGHTGMAVTIGHYVQSAGIVARALENLPQPSAFADIKTEAEEKGGAA
jgi:integrase